MSKDKFKEVVIGLSPNIIFIFLHVYNLDHFIELLVESARKQIRKEDLIIKDLDILSNLIVERTGLGKEGKRVYINEILNVMIDYMQLENLYYTHSFETYVIKGESLHLIFKE